MGWLIVAVLALLAFALLALVLRAPRAGWEAIAAALVLGIAGYALQAHPGLAGAPRAPDERIAGDAAALVEARQAFAGGPLAGRPLGAGDNWLMVADALARHGQFADASGVLLLAVDKDPRNAQAWLAMGNALVGHAGGQLTPAALYAYRRASALAPDAPGPRYFLGLALAGSGRLDEARAQWAEVLARAPADASWRVNLAAQLQRLDRLIAAQQPGAR